MKTRITGIIAALAAVMVLAASSVGAAPALLAPGDPVAGEINYQGRLTNPAGGPLTGTFPMRFQVYDDPAAGTLLWDSGEVNVDVDKGLFNVALGIDASDFNGQGLWLRIYVNGEWLSPRQELLPAPYALSLRPGAEIKGEPNAWEGWVLRVTMDGAYPMAGAVDGTTATGAAIRGASTGGHGVYGYSEDGYAVYGYDGGSSQSRGYAGYFSSVNGVGVYGYSSASRTWSNMYAPGVYGRSLNGSGVYGLSDGSQAGVIGQSIAGRGVYGFSQDSTGVYGYTGGDSNSDYGVYGGGGNGTYAVHGYNWGTGTGLGVYGKKAGGGSGVSGVNDGAGTGTWGYSYDYNGVGGGTARVDNNYGLHTYDNLYSLNYHLLGAMMQVVQNGDDEPLELGDVVAIAGLGDAPAKGLPPVIQVRKARQANDSAVLGVVAASYAKEWFTAQSTDPTGASGPSEKIPQSDAGPVAPGDYLLVVVRGPCQVKANVAGGAIQPGDLLSAAGVTGYAAKAREVTVEGIKLTAPGAILGKALEALAADRDLIYIFVTLQ